MFWVFFCDFFSFSSMLWMLWRMWFVGCGCIDWVVSSLHLALRCYRFVHLGCLGFAFGSTMLSFCVMISFFFCLRRFASVGCLCWSCFFFRSRGKTGRKRVPQPYRSRIRKHDHSFLCRFFARFGSKKIFHHCGKPTRFMPGTHMGIREAGV